MKAPGIAMLVIFLISNLKMVGFLFNEFTATPLPLILGQDPGAPALLSVPSGSWGRGATGKPLANRGDPKHYMPTAPHTSFCLYRGVIPG